MTTFRNPHERIEQLLQRVDELEAALRPFALFHHGDLLFCDECDGSASDCEEQNAPNGCEWRQDIMRARAALAGSAVDRGDEP